MYSFADYKAHYEDCEKSLRIIKSIIKQNKLKEITLSPEIKKSREYLISLFAKPELNGICKNCRGDCCVTSNFCLRPFELFCFCIENPDFEFPQPDWRFLDEELKRNKLLINNHCLFLDSHGCLLNEHRPAICLLFYDCDLSFRPDNLKAKLKEVLSAQEMERIFFLQTKKYVIARESFCNDLLRSAGISKNSLLAVEIKGTITSGVIGYKTSLSSLEKLSDLYKNKSP
ncbi:MAG: hypothetical protein HYV47_02785 [Candidatus Nealsonbacteria bacterium]|nr:hypothetical protein [Candidatus Nealsonbacteria bacterium]